MTITWTPKRFTPHLQGSWRLKTEVEDRINLGPPCLKRVMIESEVALGMTLDFHFVKDEEDSKWEEGAGIEKGVADVERLFALSGVINRHRMSEPKVIGAVNPHTINAGDGWRARQTLGWDFPYVPKRLPL